MNQDRAVCAQNADILTQTIEYLGFLVNHSKSVLVPCQKIVCFGFCIDSVEFKVFLTEEKVQKILTKAEVLMEKGVVVIRELASFIGLIISVFFAVFEAKLHYRDLERNKILGLNGSTDFDKEVALSESSLQELRWWSQNIVAKNGKLIRPIPVTVKCRTDASLEGYGGIEIDSDRHVHVNSRWSYEESQHSINFFRVASNFFMFFKPCIMMYVVLVLKYSLITLLLYLH